MSVFTMGALQAALPCTIPRPRAAAAPQMRLMPQYQGMARSQRLGVSFPGESVEVRCRKPQAELAAINVFIQAGLSRSRLSCLQGAVPVTA